MKILKLLMFILFIFLLNYGFSQNRGGWESNVKDCFCCEDQGIYNLPNPPVISYTPYNHPSNPTAICPCSINKFSTTSCPGATYAWTVTPSSVLISGGTTNQITITGGLLTPPLITSISVTVVITCKEKKVSATKTIPVLSGCNNPSNFTYSVNIPPTGNGTLTASTNCRNFGTAWVLRKYPIGTITQALGCKWYSGSLSTVSYVGTNFSTNTIVRGFEYILAYYEERCQSNWANACQIVKYECFTIQASNLTARMTGKWVGAKSTTLNNGDVLYSISSDFEIPDVQDTEKKGN